MTSFLGPYDDSDLFELVEDLVGDIVQRRGVTVLAVQRMPKRDDRHGACHLVQTPDRVHTVHLPFMPADSVRILEPTIEQVVRAPTIRVDGHNLNWWRAIDQFGSTDQFGDAA